MTLRPDNYIKREHYQALMTDMTCYDLKPSANGHTFDGILFRAGISRVKGLFDDGKFISTSTVIMTGKLPNDYWFVETKTGSRYMIASALELSAEPDNLDRMMHELLRLIESKFNK